MRKLMLVGLLFLTVQAFSQTDTVIISKEKPDSVDVKYDRIYKLFVEENNQEIRHLFKLGFTPFGKPELSIEQRFLKHFSNECGVFFEKRMGNYLKFYKNTNIEFDDYDLGLFGFPISIGFSEEVKWYYNYNRRLLSGKKVNGFSGNYFSIGYTGQLYKYSKTSYSLYPDVRVYSQELKIAYGLQRRIGNIGFIEPSLFLNFYPSADYSCLLYRPELQLKLGFAVDYFYKQKKIQKKITIYFIS